uniref:RNA polymerase I-specific transcription initiation factor RRN3 n=2 Tax=Caenorhabditis tropicalis TaxID=1561998 RepID=A0A1I7TFT8_9PELO
MMKRSTASAPHLSPKHESESDVKKVKLEPTPPSQAPTGREIIQNYLKGDVTAAVLYRKICNALETFEQWESETPKIQLLEQFLNAADAMDARTDLLVKRLLSIRWDKIPSSVFDRFRTFLCEVAIRHLAFTEDVYFAVIQRLIPQVSVNEETGVVTFILTEEQQNEHYEMAHYIVSSVLRCFPLSAKTVLKCVKRAMPHIVEPPVTVAGYMRNLILMQKYIPSSIAKEVWEVVFERLARDDAHNWRCEQNEEENKSPRLFALNDDILIEEVIESTNNSEDAEQRKGEQTLQYLDSVCTDIISFIRESEGENEVENVDEKWLKSFKITGDNVQAPEKLFGTFMAVLESTMLNATHVQYISFIWLYFGSLKTEYEQTILEQLWQITIRMPRAPADARRSQGAAAYLAAFLARAKYVKKDTAFTWLEELFNWLRRYVDQFGSGSSQILPGLQRHGTFYSISQTFFLVFAFRYKEFVKDQDTVETLRRWGFGRIIHSPLEPLKFVSKPVARCFSAITRSLQLVYCNHVIPTEEVQRPFDDMFPFDGFHLRVSAQFMTPLMRKFSPLAEDLSTLTKALCWNSAAAAQDKSEKTDSSEGLDFLDEDEIVTGFRERTFSCGQSSLNIYSATPGLKSFNV